MRNDTEPFAQIKQIKSEIAHCMAFFGNNPAELMYMVEKLVIEWYEKGLNTNNGRNNYGN